MAGITDREDNARRAADRWRKKVRKNKKRKRGRERGSLDPSDYDDPKQHSRAMKRHIAEAQSREMLPRLQALASSMSTVAMDAKARGDHGTSYAMATDAVVQMQSFAMMMEHVARDTGEHLASARLHGLMSQMATGISDPVMLPQLARELENATKELLERLSQPPRGY